MIFYVHIYPLFSSIINNGSGILKFQFCSLFLNTSIEGDVLKSLKAPWSNIEIEIFICLDITNSEADVSSS